MLHGLLSKIKGPIAKTRNIGDRETKTGDVEASVYPAPANAPMRAAKLMCVSVKR